MSRSESPARGRALLLRVLAVVAAVSLSGACAVGGGDEPSASDEPLPGLAEEAAPLSADEQATATTVAGGAPTTTAPGSPATTPGGSATTVAAGGASTTTSHGAAAAEEKVLAVIDDPQGDALGGPGYADLRRIEVVSSGSDLRVTVDVAGPLPAALAEGEVVGLGFDLFRGAPGTESEYQLFADGGAHGWRAYLHTPEGFVEYPGRFAVGGSRLVFEVPWTAVGGRSAFRASLFEDWSKRQAVIASSSEDHAPDVGTRDVPAP